VLICCSLCSCIIGLHQVHEMQTIVTDVRSVCKFVSSSIRQFVMWLNSASLCGVIRAAFARLFWPLVSVLAVTITCLCGQFSGLLTTEAFTAIASYAKVKSSLCLKLW